MVRLLEDLITHCLRIPFLAPPTAPDLHRVLAATDDHILLSFSFEALPQDLARTFFFALLALYSLHLNVTTLNFSDFLIIEKMLALDAKTIEDDLFGNGEHILESVKSFILNGCVSQLYFCVDFPHQKVSIHQNCPVAAVLFEFLVPKVHQHRVDLFDHELCDYIPDFISFGAHSVTVGPLQGLVATIV